MASLRSCATEHRIALSVMNVPRACRWSLIGLSVLGLFTTAREARCAETIILDRTHESRVFQEARHYRIFLPPAYESSTQRYPVIYFFHGYGERYNKCLDGKNCDRGNDYGGDNIASFVATHDVVIVKWDGYNPRTPGEEYPRPYNVGPVETNRQFPLYFPELVAYIDSHYRTIADREHRATAGLSMGGFMSYWIAGKYPDLVSSASSFMGSPEFIVGPREFPVEYRHDELAGNYAGVRTRLVTGTRDFIQFYHRQMNLLWRMPTHETENFDSGHGTPGMAKTLEFHMNAFAAPLPHPESWNHIDVYPNFSAWGWTVETNRNQPGFTSLRDVSRGGFWFEVRNWLPGGKLLRDVRLKVTTAPLFARNAEIKVTTLHGTQQLKTDQEGRLHIAFDGGYDSIGFATEPLRRAAPPAIARAPITTDFQIADHRTLRVFQHAVEKRTIALGEGNGDGRVNPGEQIAILFPDGDAYRAAELFSLDPCADLTSRVSDNWSGYDYVGASAKYTLARIAANCPANHVIKMLARVLIPNKPNHQVREFTIELPITVN